MWKCVGKDRKLVRCKSVGVGALDEKSKKVISKWEMIKILIDLNGDLELANEIIEDILAQYKAHVMVISIEKKGYHTEMNEKSVDMDKDGAETESTNNEEENENVEEDKDDEMEI